MAASGLSAREIADLLGYTRRTVRRYLEPDPPEPWSAFGPAEPG